VGHRADGPACVLRSGRSTGSAHVATGYVLVVRGVTRAHGGGGGGRGGGGRAAHGRVTGRTVDLGDFTLGSHMLRSRPSVTCLLTPSTANTGCEAAPRSRDPCVLFSSQSEVSPQLLVPAHQLFSVVTNNHSSGFHTRWSRPGFQGFGCQPCSTSAVALRPLRATLLCPTGCFIGIL